jgi:prepilin-type N-terminal cleavage/methylation domain-containing protein
MAYDFMKRKGFTLLELLIVIAIIGVLISVGVVSYSQAQRKTRNSRRRSDIKALQNAWEQYYADNNGKYPYSSGCPDASSMTTYLPGGYPTDPKDGSTYMISCGVASSPTYCFCATLEGESGNSDGTANADGTCNFTTAVQDHYCASSLQ